MQAYDKGICKKIISIRFFSFNILNRWNKNELEQTNQVISAYQILTKLKKLQGKEHRFLFSYECDR